MFVYGTDTAEAVDEKPDEASGSEPSPAARTTVGTVSDRREVHPPQRALEDGDLMNVGAVSDGDLMNVGAVSDGDLPFSFSRPRA